MKFKCVSINKDLFEHSHAHLIIVYGCFHTTAIEYSSFDRDHMVHKSKNIYYPVLYKINK